MTGGGGLDSQRAVLPAPVCSARRHFFSVIAKFQPNAPKRPKNLLSQTRAISLLSLANAALKLAHLRFDTGIFIDGAPALLKPRGD